MSHALSLALIHLYIAYDVINEHKLFSYLSQNIYYAHTSELGFDQVEISLTTTKNSHHNYHEFESVRLFL